MEESLKKLEQKFKARYESYKMLKGHSHTAKAWKRAWLDVKKELRANGIYEFPDSQQKSDSPLNFNFEYKVETFELAPNMHGAYCESLNRLTFGPTKEGALKSFSDSIIDDLGETSSIPLRITSEPV